MSGECKFLSVHITIKKKNFEIKLLIKTHVTYNATKCLSLHYSLYKFHVFQKAWFLISILIMKFAIQWHKKFTKGDSKSHFCYFPSIARYLFNMFHFTFKNVEKNIGFIKICCCNLYHIKMTVFFNITH